MNTVSFYDKYGSLSSIRTGSSSLRLTAYAGSSKGGVTFKDGGITSRFNNKGQSMGTGLKTGGRTTYFGRPGSIVSKLPGFK